MVKLYFLLECLSCEKLLLRISLNNFTWSGGNARQNLSSSTQSFCHSLKFVENHFPSSRPPTTCTVLLCRGGILAMTSSSAIYPACILLKTKKKWMSLGMWKKIIKIILKKPVCEYIISALRYGAMHWSRKRFISLKYIQRGRAKIIRKG